MANSNSSDFSSSLRINKQANLDQTGSDGETSLYYSENAGSEELHEMYCENICYQEGMHNTAVAFCTDCEEYFCKNCLKFHKQYMPGHKLLENSNMPQDVCLEKCEVHNDQIIKFYCPRCDKFACKLCKDRNHKSCRQVNHVPLLVQGIEKGQELKDVEQGLKKIDVKLTEIQSNINKNLNSKEIIRNNAEFAIESHAENISHMISNIKDRLKFKANKKKEYDSKRLNDFLLLHKTLKTETEEIQNKIKYQKGALERCKLFITLKKARKDMKDFEERLEDIKEKNVLQEYQFEPGKNLKTLDDEDFGKIVFGDEHGKDSEKMPKQDINVKAEDEFLDCAIWNICQFQEHFLTVCDGRNCSIKVIDLRTNKIVSVMPINNPICVSKVNDNKLVVSCINANELSFMSLSMTGILGNLNQTIRTEMPCWDIVCKNNQLITAMFQIRSKSPGKIQVLNTSGEVLKSIQCDFRGKSFRISKITPSPNGMSLFMVDLMKDAVIKISTDGKLIAIYESKNLTQVHGLTTGRDGSVYVCNSGSYQIHKLSQDFTQSEVQFDKSHGLWRPISIACSSSGNKLYVGQAHQNSIKVFNI